MIDIETQGFRAVIGNAIQKMVFAEHFRAGSIISLPIMYPSGASVVVEVTSQRGKFFVSDRGGGFAEAELMGASRYFKKEALKIAEEAGINFDGHDMFVAEVSVGSIEGAITVVANCSHEATSRTVFRMAERSENDAKEMLFERLSAVFGKADVAKDAEFIGASNHPWKVSVLVTGQKRIGFFEPVNNNYVSIVGTTAKFYDFAKIEKPHQRVSVIKSRQDLGDFYGVIAGASSRIIEITASNDEFRKLVA